LLDITRSLITFPSQLRFTKQAEVLPHSPVTMVGGRFVGLSPSETKLQAPPQVKYEAL